MTALKYKCKYTIHNYRDQVYTRDCIYSTAFVHSWSKYLYNDKIKASKIFVYSNKYHSIKFKYEICPGYNFISYKFNNNLNT